MAHESAMLGLDDELHSRCGRCSLCSPSLSGRCFRLESRAFKTGAPVVMMNAAVAVPLIGLAVFFGCPRPGTVRSRSVTASAGSSS